MTKLSTQEQIHNLETILKQQGLSSENRGVLLKEIARLKKSRQKNFFFFSHKPFQTSSNQTKKYKGGQ